VVRAIAAHVRKAETERTRAKPPNSWQAYDYYLQAADTLDSFNASLRVDDLYEARGLLQRSLAIDPNYARSYAAMAHTHVAVWINGLDSDFLSPGALDHAHQLAQKAVELDPNLAEAHASLGHALMFKREFDVSIAEFERAIVLNPSYVNFPFGVALVFAGDQRRAIDVIKDYVRLDPLHAPLASGILGFAHYMLQQYAQALRVLRDCISRSPNFRSGHVWLAATYAQMGQLGEARAEVAEVMRLDPNYTIGGVARPTAAFKNAEDDKHTLMGCAKPGCQNDCMPIVAYLTFSCARPRHVRIGSSIASFPGRQLPVYPPTTDICQFLGWFGALPIQATVTSENCRPWAQRNIVGGRILSRFSVL
jgi:adenylate cyclase